MTAGRQARKAFIRFHRLRHPAEMGKAEVEELLSWLAGSREEAGCVLTHLAEWLGQVWLRRSKTWSKEARALLMEVHAHRATMRSMCSGSADGRLYVQSDDQGTLRVARMPNSAAAHVEGCVHAVTRDLSATFGSPEGAIVVDDDGQVVVRFPLLFADTPSSSGNGGGIYVVPNRGPRLLSLLWLLIVRAGLNAWHPALQFGNCWADLRDAARQIAVMHKRQRSDLANLLLLPLDIHEDQSRRNYAKLLEAFEQDQPALVVAQLPRITVNAAGEQRLDLAPTLGVSVRVYHKELEGGLRRFSEASSRWKDGDDILMLGLVRPFKFRPKNAKKDRLYGSVDSFALLPVSLTMNPLPTSSKRAKYLQCEARRLSYMTSPQDDRLLAIWFAHRPRQ